MTSHHNQGGMPFEPQHIGNGLKFKAAIYILWPLIYCHNPEQDMYSIDPNHCSYQICFCNNRWNRNHILQELVLDRQT